MTQRNDFSACPGAADALIARGQKEVGRGIYVWGAKGQTVSDLSDQKRAAFFAQRETADATHTKAQNIARCESLYQKRRAAGVDPIRAFDCSGFLYWLLHAEGLCTVRRNSRGYYAACARNTDGGMTKDELLPGDLVFRHDGTRIVHVALYIGDGRVLESGGRDVGVQVRALSVKDNRFGRLACIGVTEKKQPETGRVVRVRYGTVRVRAGNSVNAAPLFTARGGQTFPLLGVDDETGWYRIRLDGDCAGYISCRADLTEVIGGGEQ